VYAPPAERQTHGGKNILLIQSTKEMDVPLNHPLQQVHTHLWLRIMLLWDCSLAGVSLLPLNTQQENLTLDLRMTCCLKNKVNVKQHWLFPVIFLKNSNRTTQW
jgi:hypothetical protein